MSELKNQLNLCKIDKILFAPYVPSDNYETGSSVDIQSGELLQQNCESLEMLLQSNMFVFCRYASFIITFLFIYDVVSQSSSVE